MKSIFWSERTSVKQIQIMMITIIIWQYVNVSWNKRSSKFLGKYPFRLESKSFVCGLWVEGNLTHWNPDFKCRHMLLVATHWRLVVDCEFKTDGKDSYFSRQRERSTKHLEEWKKGKEDGMKAKHFGGQKKKLDILARMARRSQMKEEVLWHSVDRNIRDEIWQNAERMPSDY